MADRFELFSPRHLIVYDVSGPEFAADRHYIWDWEVSRWIPSFQSPSFRDDGRLFMPMQTFADVPSAWAAYQRARERISPHLTVLTVLARSSDFVQLGMVGTSSHLFDDMESEPPPWFGPPTPVVPPPASVPPAPTAWARLLTDTF
jgi:hypothetical protein